MKTILNYGSAFSLLALLFMSCTNTTNRPLAINTVGISSEKTDAKTRSLSQEFKSYWYAGNAEITSYRLQQARYGELREGTAMTIYVTEDFLPEAQVKADRPSNESIPVLKLNATKNFLTGIYPYSIMTSTFSPAKTEGHAIKVTNSVQEWCGQVYSQLNNRKKFEIESYSYFESEGDRSLRIAKSLLENDLWNLIRINPEELPTGEFDMIPAFEYLRLRHKQIKAYPATLSLKQGDSLSIYKIEYPTLDRDLTIYFSSDFPYTIEKWKETALSGFGANVKALTTKATKIKRIKTAYWTQNAIEDVVLRDTLGLK